LRLAEKVTRNIGILRRELTGGGSRSLVESVVEGALPRQEIPDYARKTRLNSLLTAITQKDIPDEEQAANYYQRMSLEADALGLHPMAEILRKMSSDELSHLSHLRRFVEDIKAELARIV